MNSPTDSIGSLPSLDTINRPPAIVCKDCRVITGPRSACHSAESLLMNIIAWGPQVTE